MDWMWFCVSVAICVEVVRQTHQKCYAQKKTTTTPHDGLEAPLLRADGTCPYPCCAQEVEESETDVGYDTGDSSDEIVPDEILSGRRSSRRRAVSVRDNGKAPCLIEEDRMHEIAGLIYPDDPGWPELVQFKVSENGGTSGVRKESSEKIHPQLNEEAEYQAHSSVDTSSSKDQHFSDHRVVPPIQEVRSRRSVPYAKMVSLWCFARDLTFRTKPHATLSSKTEVVERLRHLKKSGAMPTCQGSRSFGQERMKEACIVCERTLLDMSRVNDTNVCFEYQEKKKRNGCLHAS